MPTSLIRRIKRLLVLAGELGFLVFGFSVSFALTAYLDRTENSLALPAFYAGLILTVVGYVVIRRRTRSWKIEYDAVGWARTQTERKLHPNRARYKRLAGRMLVWVPSLIAAGVLFFFPVATHLVHPSSHYLRHYRVPIPWNIAVFSSLGPPAPYSFVDVISGSGGRARFGMTPFWDSGQPSSQMIFGTIPPNAETFEFNHHVRDSKRGGATSVSRREFRPGKVSLTCWQYLKPRRNDVSVGSDDRKSAWWDIDCETAVNVHEQNLYAWFVGRAADIPAFYKIIEGITTVQ